MKSLPKTIQWCFLKVIILLIYQIVFIHSQQNYISIPSSNFTSTLIDLKTSNPFTYNKKIINCPTKVQYLISTALVDFHYQNVQSFNITMETTLSSSSLQFSIGKENEIQFNLTEICMKNVNVVQVQILSPQFTNSVLKYTTDLPSLQTEYSVSAFITGYQQQLGQNNNYLFLTLIEQNNGKVTFTFQTENSAQFNYIYFNYITFPKSDYDPTNRPYYAIQSYREQANQNIQSPNDLLTGIQGNRTFNFPIQLNTKNYYNNVYGITGFNVCTTDSDGCDGVRAAIYFNGSINQIIYDTWFTSKIFGITSQFLQFQMLNCSSVNQTINFNDSCQSSCPPGYYSTTDQTNLFQTCSQCSNSCPTCIDNSTNCTSCDSSMPYLHNGQCSQSQPQNTKCSTTDNNNYQSCSDCSPDCNLKGYKYCDQSGKCLYCPQNQYAYLTSTNCISGLPPANKYNSDGVYQDCDKTCTTCSNNTQNSCLSCDEIQFTLAGTSCLCKDQTKGYESKSQSCLSCTLKLCSQCTNNYQECQSCSSGFTLTNGICMCAVKSQYYDSTKNKCIDNPNTQNCQNTDPFKPLCTICSPGFYNLNGSCKYCGRGKYTNDQNQCSNSCMQYCIECSDQTSCQSYSEDIPCYQTCSVCTAPNSPSSCLICISSTRQLNAITKTCDCIGGYEETNETDCKEMQDLINSSVISNIGLAFSLAYYVKLPFVFLPIYPFFQYSFNVLQHIGIVALFQEIQGKSLRLDAMRKYSQYNFYTIGSQVMLSQQINEFIQYANGFSLVLFLLLIVSLLMHFCPSLNKFSIPFLIKQNAFIVTSRILSNFSIFLGTYLQTQFDLIQTKDKIFVSLLIIVMILYCNYLVIITKNTKKENNSEQSLNNSFNQIYSERPSEESSPVEAQNLPVSMRENITIESTLNTYIWVLFEIRKIITIQVLYFFKDKFWGLLPSIGLSAIFLMIIITNKTFKVNEQMAYVIITEITYISVMISQTFILRSGSEVLSEYIYLSPSNQDILMIIFLLFQQFADVVISVYTFYELLKSLYKSCFTKSQKKPNTKYPSSFVVGNFPNEFNASTIDDILSSSVQSYKNFAKPKHH